MLSRLVRTHRSRALRVFLLVSLVAATLALAAPQQTASATSGFYTDDDNNIHEWAIEAITAAGVATGCNWPDNTLFCPSDPINRVTMAMWLTRALGEEGNMPSYRGYFTDVLPGDYFAPYVERLYELGVTVGVGNGKYDPWGAVTRAQMAVYLVRAFGDGSAIGPATGYFADVDLSSWYPDFVEKLYDMGITAGCGTNPLIYCPDMQVPRDQMATFVARGMGFAPSSTVTDIWDPPDCPAGGFCLTPSLSEGFGKRDISYCIADFSNRLIDEWAMAAEAFSTFGGITVGSTPMFTFSIVDCASADIELNWVYSLPGGVNGNAAPDNYFTPSHVVINIRDDGSMTDQIELSTLIHEIGHALGLNHSLDTNCIMFPDAGGVAMQTGTLCQEELDTLGSLYTGFVGSGADTFYTNYVTASGQSGPVETVATLTNSGTMPLPCAVDAYWVEDLDMGWHCSWFDNGIAWGWQVERIDNDYDGPGFGVSLSAMAIATAAYDVAWVGVETVWGNATRSFSYNATNNGLVVPFVITHDPNGDDNYGWQMLINRTPAGSGQTYTWDVSTFDGNSSSYVQVAFVKIEPRDNWGWSYAFHGIRGSGSGSSALVEGSVSAFNWSDTAYFSVTTGYQPVGANQWLWDTYMSPSTAGCPGSATRCVNVTLSAWGGNTSSYAEVMTVVLGR